MNQFYVRKIRNVWAESGIEKTPQEVERIIQRTEEVFDSVSYEEYLQYKALSDRDIRTMAKDTGSSYKEAKDIVDIVLYIGELKFD